MGVVIHHPRYDMHILVQRQHMKRLLFFLPLILLWSVIPTHAQGATGDLLNRVNALRTSNGLQPYTINASLQAAAQNHAAWMATTGDVSHVQPDGSRPRDRAAAAGYGSTWVAENIYIGSIATTDNAWIFWINSPVHYAGLTSPNYQHVGIATSNGAGGRSFVMVFGNPGGTWNTSSNRSTSGGGNDAEAAAPSGPPPFVVGWDAQGNIMHEVQPGDTLGDIALIYGYTWDDLPRMLDLNEMTWDDVRVLSVGQVFLVPPQSGTYTPSPQPTLGTTEEAPPPTNTPQNIEPEQQTVDSSIPTPFPEDVQGNVVIEPTPQSVAMAQTGDTQTELLPPAVFVMATETPTPTLTPSTTVDMVVRPLAQPTEGAMVVETAPQTVTTPVSSRNTPPLWLLGAITIQVSVLGYAVVEFVRRMRA